MKAFFPFMVVLLCLSVMIPVFYYLSPQAELIGLRTENSQLRERLAEAKADSSENIVAIVVIGFLSLTVIFLTAFFLLLCLLSGRGPMQFFSVRKPYAAIPDNEKKPIEQAESVRIPAYYVNGDSYYMEV